MDFHDALVAHLRWKRRFTSRTIAPSPALCVGLLASAEQCDLGQWLAGEGSKFAELPEFAGLLASHSRFHQAASDLLSKDGFGQPMNHDSDPEVCMNFIDASNDIVTCLVVFLKKVFVAQ